MGAEFVVRSFDRLTMSAVQGTVGALFIWELYSCAHSWYLEPTSQPQVTRFTLSNFNVRYFPFISPFRNSNRTGYIHRALIVPYLKSIVISFTNGGDETSYMFDPKGCTILTISHVSTSTKVMYAQSQVRIREIRFTNLWVGLLGFTAKMDIDNIPTSLLNTLRITNSLMDTVR